MDKGKQYVVRFYSNPEAVDVDEYNVFVSFTNKLTPDDRRKVLDCIAKAAVELGDSASTDEDIFNLALRNAAKHGIIGTVIPAPYDEDIEI